jgi:hypothetical protein
LGIIHFNYSKLLVSINDPMLDKPRSRWPMTCLSIFFSPYFQLFSPIWSLSSNIVQCIIGS